MLIPLGRTASLPCERRSDLCLFPVPGARARHPVDGIGARERLRPQEPDGQGQPGRNVLNLILGVTSPWRAGLLDVSASRPQYAVSIVSGITGGGPARATSVDALIHSNLRSSASPDSMVLSWLGVKSAMRLTLVEYIAQ